MYDYADFGEQLLNYRPVIIIPQGARDTPSRSQAVPRFQERFGAVHIYAETVRTSFMEVANNIGCGVLYMIKRGRDCVVREN